MNMYSDNESSPRRLRDRLKEATAVAILEAAEKVFAARGVHSAKMEEIASGAGVAVGTLYNHFKDRESIFESLVVARREELIERVDAALSGHAREPFVAQLTAFIRALAEHLDAHREFLAILMAAEHSQTKAKIEGPTSRATITELYHRLEELVRRGVRQKALRPEDASLYPTLLMGILRGLMLRRLYYDQEAQPLSERIGPLVRFFLKGAGV